jgi:Integrase core domain
LLGGGSLDTKCLFRFFVARHEAEQAFRWFIVGCALACGAVAQQPSDTLHNTAGVVDAPRPSLSLAQTPVGAPTPANPQDGPLYLSLQEAFRMALKNNLDIEFEQVDQTVADLSVPLTEGGGLPFDRTCHVHGIEHRLTKPNHPWTNGQVERMNRTIKEATVKRFFYDTHEQLKAHLSDFIAAYNFARRLKTLRGLTPYEAICKLWTQEPDRFTLDPIHQMPGLNT